jgi:hypothetical protein
MSDFHNQFVPDLLQYLNQELQALLSDPSDTKVTRALRNEEGFYVMLQTLTENNEQEYQVRSNKGIVARFNLSPMPGCCGVVVSHYARVHDRLQKTDFSNSVALLMYRVRMNACRKMKYGHMIATVSETNSFEKPILKELGWIKTGTFRNPKTQNIVETYSTNL